VSLGSTAADVGVISTVVLCRSLRNTGLQRDYGVRKTMRRRKDRVQLRQLCRRYTRLGCEPFHSPHPEFQAFSDDVAKTLELLSAKLRGERVAEREFPDLREAYLRLTQAGDPQQERYVLANVEADRMVNSLNTLREQVFTWRRSLRAEPVAAAND
jgi:hypothetical protein